ncbi:MAG: hypothetical protein HZC51_06100 [Nitrospirae bacterium]|nr:hypothetical protein [Nitrospirota bacterium]
MKKPKRGGYVEHANRILSVFEEEIPKREWRNVLYLVNYYVEYYFKEGYRYRKKRRTKSR